jgi:type II secretory pathway component GspD/PulD (secretin)
MRLHCDGRGRRTMKLAMAICGVALGLALSGPGAWAQTPAPAKAAAADATPAKTTFDAAAAAKTRADYSALPVQTFYLKNVSSPNEANEIQTAIRNILPPDAKIYLVPTQNAIILRATTDQIALAQKLIDDLDRPKKNYRLTYTMAEMEGGKRVGVQHFGLVVAEGQRSTLKQGSKVPYLQGPNAQFQYLDVGMNFEVSLDKLATGMRLRTKVEQSSVAEEKSGVGGQDPVIRQTTLEGTSFVDLGKPLLLGSLDTPGSTRHLDVEVLMELVP